MTTNPMTTNTMTSGPEAARTTAAGVHAATKVYGTGDAGVRALDDVTLELPSGRFTAIMGPSGSGKSTLMHCLAGLDSLTSGRVTVGGKDLARLSDRQLTALRRERIGFVFQAFNLIPSLSAYDNVVLPYLLGGRQPDRAWVDEVIRAVRLGNRLEHRPAQLSGGQQQRVAVARALVTRPDVVFADEPTGNLDSRSGAEVLDFLGTAVEDLDQTVVMVTHDPTAAAHAEGIVFLADGRVVDQMLEPSSQKVLDRLKALGD